MAALAVPGLLSRLAQQKEFLKGQLDLICSDDDCALEKVGTQAQADEMRKSFEQLLESRRRCKAFEMALQTLQQRRGSRDTFLGRGPCFRARGAGRTPRRPLVGVFASLRRPFATRRAAAAGAGTC